MAQTDPPVRNKLLTLDAFVSQVYLPYVKLRKRSWRIDERMARKHLSPVFGDKPITKIRRCEVQDVQDVMDNPAFCRISQDLAGRHAVRHTNN